MLPLEPFTLPRPASNPLANSQTRGVDLQVDVNPSLHNENKILVALRITG
jgi:hypothetical protein